MIVKDEFIKQEALSGKKGCRTKDFQVNQILARAINLARLKCLGNKGIEGKEIWRVIQALYIADIAKRFI